MKQAPLLSKFSQITADSIKISRAMRNIAKLFKIIKYFFGFQILQYAHTDYLVFIVIIFLPKPISKGFRFHLLYKMMHGLKVAGIDINRKMLAEMAVNDAEGFKTLAELAKKAFAFIYYTRQLTDGKLI